MRVIAFLLVIINLQVALAEITDLPRADDVIIVDTNEYANPLLQLDILWIEEARTQALNILRVAQKSAYLQKDQELAKRFKETQEALAKAKVVAPKSGSDFFFCNMYSGMLAFVTVFNRNKIHLCKYLVDANPDVHYLAEVLIHEGAHSAGFYSECKASEIEVAAMVLSGVGVQFQSSYWEKCGLK